MKQRVVFLAVLFVVGCKPKTAQKEAPLEIKAEASPIDTVSIEQKEAQIQLKSLEDFADTTFIRLADFSTDFMYDMRYATTNNFLKSKVYDCAECYIRTKTAKALLLVNQEFMDKGYKIKFFDCYRPNSVQYKMWELVPNPQYVANPVKGSIHNKGGAVDITLVDFNGTELNMGTDFDFFGKRAHHDYTNLPEEVLINRKLLKETMEKYGFWSIRTEWWHYNLSGGSKDKVADFKWRCND